MLIYKIIQYQNIIQLQQILALMKNYDQQSQPNSTQRLSTLKRNAKIGYYGPSQQQYINQLAKIRLLEDQMMTLKIKSQSLQRKNHQYIQTIAQLQYAIGDLKIMLDKADFQLKRHFEVDRQIQLYSSNLRQVGHQLSSLNEVLEKKNKQCQKLLQLNSKLKQQNSQLEYKIKQMHNRKQIQKNKLRQILQGLTTENQPSFNEQLLRDMEMIEEGIADLKDNLNKTKSALQKNRKQSSQNLMKQRQKIISLQYSLKLAQKRNQDLEKKKNMQSTFAIDKKVQDIIEQMLKKQQQLTLKISQLQLQNQQLRDQIQNQNVAHEHLIQLRKNDYQKEIRQAKSTIKQLILQKDQLSQKLQQYNNVKSIQSSRYASQQFELSRKYRQFCEQNKRLKLKISQLESDKKMLQKQLSIRSTH